MDESRKEKVDSRIGMDERNIATGCCEVVVGVGIVANAVVVFVKVENSLLQKKGRVYLKP